MGFILAIQLRAMYFSIALSTHQIDFTFAILLSRFSANSFSESFFHIQTELLRHICAFARLGEVETVEVHDLVPGRDKVTHKLFLRIVLCIDLSEGTQL